ncbi:hypothetical protein C3920_11605 [Novacetimonas pomaceti]|uniref:Uncharacterized protein n=1 Tax=Novacetimonas pomaceti TaxID=2021998 RepID=A0ABX5P029_9PROT|nr:hypothetical protein C3920_11605 [Novacetimonas pomaceti]
MKLFPKSFIRRHLFKKRRHPKTFVTYGQQHSPSGPDVLETGCCQKTKAAPETFMISGIAGTRTHPARPRHGTDGKTPPAITANPVRHPVSMLPSRPSARPFAHSRKARFSAFSDMGRAGVVFTSNQVFPPCPYDCPPLRRCLSCCS